MEWTLRQRLRKVCETRLPWFRKKWTCLPERLARTSLTALQTQRVKKLKQRREWLWHTTSLNDRKTGTRPWWASVDYGSRAANARGSVLHARFCEIRAFW